MDSDTLNKKIAKICDDDKYYKCFGDSGKSIPYIGWFWRTVDFDRKDYCFGVLPKTEGEFEHTDKDYLGFMENNKWNYDYVYCSPKDWDEIKILLEVAVNGPCYAALKAVDDKIQSLLERK